jgi:hypothetical protein
LDYYAFNQRGWTPLQLVDRENKYFKTIKENLQRKQLKSILFDSGVMNNISLSVPEEYIYKYNSKFHYAFVSVADNENINKTTLAIQLKLVKKSLDKKKDKNKKSKIEIL